MILDQILIVSQVLPVILIHPQMSKLLSLIEIETDTPRICYILQNFQIGGNIRKTMVSRQISHMPSECFLLFLHQIWNFREAKVSFGAWLQKYLLLGTSLSMPL